MARRSESDLRKEVTEIFLLLAHITDGREEQLDLRRLIDKIARKLDILRLKMTGNELFEHVLDISVTEDNELYSLFKTLAGFVEDQAAENSLADVDRIQLTSTCEQLLEVLSSAPNKEGTGMVEPKAYLQELYGQGPDTSWDELLEHAEKAEKNVKRLSREVFRFKRALKLGRKSLESYEVKYAQIEGLDCQEKDTKNEIDYTMIGMRKVLSFMEASTKDDWSEENVEALGSPEEEPTIQKSHLEQKEIQLQGLIIEALGFLMVGHGSTGNSRVAADRLFNRILALSRNLGIHP